MVRGQDDSLSDENLRWHFVNTFGFLCKMKSIVRDKYAPPMSATITCANGRRYLALSRRPGKYPTINPSDGKGYE